MTTIQTSNSRLSADIENLNRDGGYVLQQVQLLNWGPFSDKVWTYAPQGKRNLLIGENGVGKSTISDAVVTLMVPNAKSHFNRATGESNSGERDLYTYVRGKWGETQDRQSKKDSQEYLRPENTSGILVARFVRLGYENRSSGVFTIAQIMTVKKDEANQVKRTYISAASPLSIVDDLAPYHQDTRALRKHLQQRDPAALVTSTASEYHDSICATFGLAGKHVLTFLGRAISLKSIGDLESFVRDFLIVPAKLDRPEDSTEYRVDKIKDSFVSCRNLESSIAQTQQLIQDLEHLTTHYADLEGANKRLAMTSVEQQVGTHFIYKTQADLLSSSYETKYAEHANVEKELKTVQAEVNALKAEHEEVSAQVNASTSTAYLNQKHQVQQLENKDVTTRREHQIFTSVLGELNWSIPKNQAELDTTLETVKRKFDEIDSKREELEAQKEALQIERQKINERKGVLIQDIERLKSQKGNIPYAEMEFRDQLARRLNVGKEELPFLAELAKVKDEAKDWTPAIEAHLGSERLRFFMPRALKLEVDRMVSGAERRTTVKYAEASETYTASELEAIPGGVLSKLEFDTNNPLWKAVRAFLVHAKDAHCVDSTDDFQDKNKAIVKTGVSKRGNNRSGFSTRDAMNPSNWMLGWSNASLQQQKQDELAEVEVQIEKVQVQLGKIGIEMAKLQKQFTHCQRLTEFNDFDRVDLAGIEAKLLAARKLLAELEAKEDVSRQLRSKRDTLKRQLVDKEEALGKVQLSLGSLNSELAREEAALKEAQKKALAFESEPTLFIGTGEPTSLYREILATCRLRMGQEAKRSSPAPAGQSSTWGVITEVTIKRDLAQPELLVTNWTDRVTSQRLALTKEISEIQSSIAGLTALINKNYISKLNSHEISGLSTDNRALVEEILLKEKTESLVSQQAELDATYGSEMSRGFKGLNEKLADRFEEVYENLESVNDVLSKVDFDAAGRFLRIQANPTRDDDIRKFRTQLKDICAINVDAGPEARAAFRAQAERLINRFSAESDLDKRWMDKVLDPSNWYDFEVLLDKPAGVLDETIADAETRVQKVGSSGSASGGERENLAYTLLTAAAMIQFGIYGDKEKFLRFLMLDECFSKCSGETATRPLRLIREVNIQACMLTPLEKMDVIEPFVDSVSLVTKKIHQSNVANWSIQEFYASAARQELLKRAKEIAKEEAEKEEVQR